MDKRIVVHNLNQNYLLSVEPITAGTRIYEAVASCAATSSPNDFQQISHWSMLPQPVEFDLDALRADVDYHEVTPEALRADVDLDWHASPKYIAHVYGTELVVDETTPAFFNPEARVLRVLDALTKQRYLNGSQRGFIVPARILNKLFAQTDPVFQKEFFENGTVSVSEDFWKPLKSIVGPSHLSHIEMHTHAEEFMFSQHIGVKVKIENVSDRLAVTYEYVWDWMEMIESFASSAGIDAETHRVSISHALYNGQCGNFLRLVPLNLFQSFQNQMFIEPFAVLNSLNGYQTTHQQLKPQGGMLNFSSSPWNNIEPRTQHF